LKACSKKELIMRLLTLTTALMIATMATTVALADVHVTFRDGAPKDMFTIANLGACSTGPMTLTIDLATAPVGLIFDITNEGEGVEVSQPFELVSGAEFVIGSSPVSDGDQSLTLELSDMAPNAEVRFTIDMDDTSGGREITVNGSETVGAMILIASRSVQAEGTFDETGIARVPLVDCIA
jgi:uncharacterized heparinase superfamily protein